MYQEDYLANYPDVYQDSSRVGKVEDVVALTVLSAAL